MKRRLVIITEIIAPYRIPVFNALAQHAEVDPYVVFLSETDPSLRRWNIYKDEIRFDYAVLPSWRRRIGKYNVLFNRGLKDSLTRIRPEAILCGGYSYVSSWSAAAWTQRTKVPLLLWSESTAHDRRNRRGLIELLKREFVRRCDAFVVPGRSSREYLRGFGVPDEEIFTAPNAVDMEFFERAVQANGDVSERSAKLGLPHRFFLYVGRLVTEKGIFELLQAYAKLSSALRSAVGLVFVGDGEKKEELMTHIAQISPRTVHCVGFRQREDLAAIYSRAEALVFPTHSDTWGLVVNEAMVCGLPVITSAVAGCAADLVEDQRNGFVVQPGDVAGLSSAMSRIVGNAHLRCEMSLRSRERIQAYSAVACASGMAEAVMSVIQGRA